jgi:hypothetical protein
MNLLIPILAQPIAPDALWPAVLLVLLLAFLHRVEGRRRRAGERLRLRDLLHRIAHWH